MLPSSGIAPAPNSARSIQDCSRTALRLPMARSASSAGRGIITERILMPSSSLSLTILICPSVSASSWNPAFSSPFIACLNETEEAHQGPCPTGPTGTRMGKESLRWKVTPWRRCSRVSSLVTPSLTMPVVRHLDRKREPSRHRLTGKVLVSINSPFESGLSDVTQIAKELSVGTWIMLASVFRLHICI